MLVTLQSSHNARGSGEELFNARNRVKAKMAYYLIDSKSGVVRTGELAEILSKAQEQNLIKSAARLCTCQPGTCTCTAPSASRSQKCLKVRVDTEKNASAGLGEKRGRWPRNNVGACCAMLILCLVVIALAMVMYAARSALFPNARSLNYLIGNGIKVADSCSDVGVGMSCATPCESAAYSVCPLGYQEQGLTPAVLTCPWGSVCSPAREGVVGCVPRDTCAVSGEARLHGATYGPVKALAPGTVRSPVITIGRLNELAPPPKEANRGQHPEPGHDIPPNASPNDLPAEKPQRTKETGQFVPEKAKERKPVSVGLGIFARVRDIPVIGWQHNLQPKTPRKPTKPADPGHEMPTAPGQPNKPGLPEQPEKPVAPEQPEKPVAPGQPEKPVAPGQPEKPVAPGQPEKPVAPGQPEKPIAPEQPGKPIAPEQPEKPVVPGQPDKPGLPEHRTATNPEQPKQPIASNQPQQPQNPSEGQSGEIDKRKIPVKPANKSPDSFVIIKGILG